MAVHVNYFWGLHICPTSHMVPVIKDAKMKLLIIQATGRKLCVAFLLW
jgi:hypothetical protein